MPDKMSDGSDVRYSFTLDGLDYFVRAWEIGRVNEGVEYSVEVRGARIDPVSAVWISPRCFISEDGEVEHLWTFPMSEARGILDDVLAKQLD